jgi:hypothetical protein
LLADNDLNATAVVINVYAVEPGQPTKFTVEVSPYFWEFLLSEHHTLKAVNPQQTRARSLVRMAFKAFEMGLPFHDHGIDPGSELLFRSHKEKIEQMAAWDANPFVGMMLTREEGNAFRLGQP